MKRHQDALAIQAGACNPLAITHSLLAAMRECADTGAIRNDPAVRLIAYQLAYLLNLSALDQPREYTAATDACEAEQMKDNLQRAALRSGPP